MAKTSLTPNIPRLSVGAAAFVGLEIIAATTIDTGHASHSRSAPPAAQAHPQT